MNKALTIPRATAGSMGAMAIIAGTVVVVATGTVVVVVTPAVPPVATPPTTVCSREGSCGREKGEEEVRLRKLSTNKTADLAATMVSSGGGYTEQQNAAAPHYI